MCDHIDKCSKCSKCCSSVSVLLRINVSRVCPVGQQDITLNIKMFLKKQFQHVQTATNATWLPPLHSSLLPMPITRPAKFPNSSSDKPHLFPQNLCRRWSVLTKVPQSRSPQSCPSVLCVKSVVWTTRRSPATPLCPWYLTRRSSCSLTVHSLLIRRSLCWFLAPSVRLQTLRLLIEANQAGDLIILRN